MDKKELFTDIVYRVYRKAYPKLFKRFGDDRFFLDKPEMFFNTDSTNHMNWWDQNVCENKMYVSFTPVVSFYAFANTIIIHLSNAFDRAMTIISPESQYYTDYNIPINTIDDKIENVMFSVIINDLLDVLMYYHNFVEIPSSPANNCADQIETMSTIFKCTYYNFLVNTLNCIPDILFNKDKNLIRQLEQDLLTDYDDICDATKAHLFYRNKTEHTNFKFSVYREIDELNLISRYVYASYMFRLSAISEISQNHEDNTAIKFRIDEILEIVSRIENCREKIKYIELYNNIDWKEILKLSNFNNMTVESKVDLTVPRKCRKKECKSVSMFLNLLPFSANKLFTVTFEETKFMSEHELYKAIVKNTLPHGYAWVLQFTKLTADVDGDTLYIRTERLEPPSNNNKAQDLLSIYTNTI